MRFGTRLDVKLEHLAYNVSSLKKISNNEILFMVKSNGYGHGDVAITNFCHQELKIKEYGLATLGEALELRKQLNSFESDLYVFSDLGLDNKNLHCHYIENKIIPVIATLTDLNYFLNSKDFKYTPLVIKINTGMNRLGIEEDKLEELIKALKIHGRLEIDHLMSHFSSSSLDLGKHKKTNEQWELFQTVKNLFSSSGIKINKTSISNSGAIEQNIGLNETHIRPGIMLYGPTALLDFQKSRWIGKNISSLKTKILKTELFKKGTPIGYGAPVLNNDSLVVYLALGYGDGISRYFSGLSIKRSNFVGQIFGRVSMDMLALTFPVEAQNVFKLHDEFIFWDFDATEINQFASDLKTISYELFCNLSSRIPRIYDLK